MNKYIKPMILNNNDLAEGIYAASGSVAGTGTVDYNKVSTEYKHNYWEIKYNFVFPSEYQGKKAKIEVHFAGNVQVAWSKREHPEERTLANNILTFIDHSIDNNDTYTYYIGVQSNESEEACNIVNVVITQI